MTSEDVKRILFESQIKDMERRITEREEEIAAYRATIASLRKAMNGDAETVKA